MVSTGIPEEQRSAEQSPSTATSLTRDAAAQIATEVARRLGATQAEAISVLRARLSDAKPWLNVVGDEDARIWLVIVRAPVGIPRLDGQTLRAERLEVAVDDATARGLGFRLAS